MTSLEKIEHLLKARQTKTPLIAFTDEEPGFTLDDGYSIQKSLLERALKNGEVLSGFKMGLTSKAKQKDVSVFEPIRGFLLKSMEIHNGGSLDLSTRIRPRVEPEVALVLKNKLEGSNVTLEEVAHSLSGVFLACEVIDSRYKDYKFKLPDVVADNTSASGYVLGTNNLLPLLEDVRLMGITLRKNGELLETGSPAAALNNPLNSLLELVKAMAKTNEALLPGQVVMTGGLTNSHFVASGDVVEVECAFDKIKFTVK